MRARELRDAATANFVVHASWAARRIPGALVESTPSLTMVDSGLRTDTFNVVCGRSPPGRRSAGGRASDRRALRRRRPTVLLVGGSRRRARRTSQTTDGGRAREQETQLAMALELSTVAPGALRAGGHRDPGGDVGADVGAFARINAENWDPPDPSVETFYREPQPRSWRQSAEGVRRAPSGEPVAALELTLAAGVEASTTSRRGRRTGAGASAARCSSGRAPSRRAGRERSSSRRPRRASLYRSFGFASSG